MLHLHADTNSNSLTQATDTSNIRLVFAAVKETILQNALKDSGILWALIHDQWTSLSSWVFGNTPTITGIGVWLGFTGVLEWLSHKILVDIFGAWSGNPTILIVYATRCTVPFCAHDGQASPLFGVSTRLFTFIVQDGRARGRVFC